MIPRHTNRDKELHLREYDSIGNPNAILKSLFDHINRTDRCPFVIVSHPILDDSSFWEFAKKNDYRMKRITFDFVVPNMWDTPSNLLKELNQVRADTGSETVKTTFSAKDNINIKDSEIIRVGVEYATKGGASIAAQSDKGEQYYSNKKTKKVKINEERNSSEDQSPFLRRIVERLFSHE